MFWKTEVNVSKTFRHSQVGHETFILNIKEDLSITKTKRNVRL